VLKKIADIPEGSQAAFDNIKAVASASVKLNGIEPESYHVISPLLSDVSNEALDGAIQRLIADSEKHMGKWCVHTDPGLWFCNCSFLLSTRCSSF